MTNEKKKSSAVDKFLKDALKEIKSLDLKVNAEEDPAPKAPVKKKPVKKAKAKPKAKAVPAPKPKKPITVKRLDESKDEVKDELAIKLDPFTKKVQTKLVVKDGIVIVQPVFNPFDES